MKIIKPLIVFILFLCGCNTNSNKPEQNNNNSVITNNNAENLNSDENIIGSYVGIFGQNGNDNKITLLISRIDNNIIEGRTIVGGNDRPFNGTIVAEGDDFRVNAKEPGDDKYDGEFNFSINKFNTNELRGNWAPFKNTTSAKSYTLYKKKFAYDANVGIYPIASTRLLNTTDVENMVKSELSYMRNEIFARHGYCFKKKDMRNMFELLDWYVPNTVDIKNFLTEIEKKNISLIKRYEEYADEYGDDYGR